MKIFFKKFGMLLVYSLGTLQAAAQSKPFNGNYHSSLELQEMFLEGLLLVALVVNLLFYKSSRDRTHLYFALMLIFLAVQRSVTTIGSYLHWDYPDVWHKLSYTIFSWAFTIYFLIKFISTFFKLKLYFPALHKILHGGGIVYGAMAFIFQFIRPGFFANPGEVISLVWAGLLSIICLIILVIFFTQIPNRGNFARLVIIGGTPLMLVWGGYQFAAQYLIFKTPTAADYQKLPWWFYAERTTEIVCIGWFVVLFFWTLILRFDQVKKENAQRAIDLERLEKEKEIQRRQLVDELNIKLEKTVDQRTAELKQSLKDLTSTQAQLIQSEKMASLGELTAGIAHEIQNPLNFVNNFSELNKELTIELEDELDQGNYVDAKAIARDIKSNEEKINHHGKRADSIVKGMLQHTRTSSGLKEPTDINALCDEYLRFSYHGLRAKEKSFNATLKTDFDTTIPTINIIPQDIGRVILNLFNNAFYAINERNLSGVSSLESVKYEPTVTVKTKKLPEAVEITIKDNGDGIPQKILDKIFQPFFTTKPTGQGTGLGLSLSYDIVKAHGGGLDVASQEGKGTEFVMRLPINMNKG